MSFVWIGLVLIIMKLAEFGPVANLSWWWILAPLAVAVLWFETLQPMLGLDKSKEDKSTEEMKKARIAKAFVTDKRRV